MAHRKNNKQNVARAATAKPDKEAIQNEALLVYTLRTDSEETLLKASEEYCYLVSEKWWEAYETYLGYNEIIEEKPLKKSFGQKYPGPVNEEIIAENQERAYKIPNNFEHFQYLWTYIKPKALENEAYTLVDAKLWEHIYGLYGGKTIKRPLRHDFSTAACDDLQKSHIIILTHSKIKEMAADPKFKTTRLTTLLGGFKNIQFHETWKMKDMLAFLSSLLEAETGVSSWTLKVWRLNNYLFLDDFWRSFEDFLQQFPEQDKFLIEAKEFTAERFAKVNLSRLLKDGYYLVVEAKESEDEEFYFDEYKLTGQNMKDLQGYCEYCNEKDSPLSFTCLCKEVFYCCEKCKYKDQPFHHYICPSAYDSDSDDEAPVEKFDPEQFRNDRGLKNLGNTCYMNSVLQAFKRTEIPEALFYSNGYLQSLKEKQEDMKQEENGNKFLLSRKFSKLMKQMSLKEKEAVAPWALKQTFALYFSNFKGYHQHDSQEFLAYLFNGLHEELCLNLDRNEDNLKVDYSNPKEYLDSSIRSSFSKFSELFQGLFSSEIKCPSCEHTSTQFDQFNMVSLPLYCKEDFFNILISFISRDINNALLSKIYKYSTNFNDSVGDLVETLKKELQIPAETPLLPAILEDENVEEFLRDTSMLLKDLKGKLEFKRKKLVVYEMPVDWDSEIDHVISIVFLTEIKNRNTGMSFKKRVGVPRIMVLKPNSSNEDTYIKIMDFLKDVYPDAPSEYLALKQNIKQILENIELQQKNAQNQVDEGDSHTERSKNTEKEMLTQQKEKETEEPKEVEKPETQTEEANERPETAKPKNKGKKPPRVSKRKKGARQSNSIKISEPAKEEVKQEKSPKKETKAKEKEIDPEELIQEFITNLPYSVRFVNKSKNFQACALCGKKTCESCNFHMNHKTPFNEVLDKCQANQLQIEFYLFFTSDIPKVMEQSLDDPNLNNINAAIGNANPSLQQCIELFSEKEVLSNENMWFCPVCNEKKQAEKRISIYYVPKYLIFHLKRFKSVEGSSNSKNAKKVKNAQPIDYPIQELDLREYVHDLAPHLKKESKKEPKFRLISVVLHEGKLDEGHYTAFGRSVDGVWRKFDDEKVQEISEKEVCHKNAYVLFYELI